MSDTIRAGPSMMDDMTTPLIIIWALVAVLAFIANRHEDATPALHRAAYAFFWPLTLAFTIVYSSWEAVHTDKSNPWERFR